MKGVSHASLLARPATAPSSPSPSTDLSVWFHNPGAAASCPHISFAPPRGGGLLPSVSCMAICEDCEQEMTEAASCVVSTLNLDGVEFATVPYGKETRFGRRYGVSTQRCHDCGVQPGGQHHPGCDWAQCPRCRHQLLSCGCSVEET